MQKKTSLLCLPVSGSFRFRLTTFIGPHRWEVWIVPILLALILSRSASAVVPLAQDIQTPAVGDHALYILSPRLLELFLVNTKQPDPKRVDRWDWVDDQQMFVTPNLTSVHVLVNGQSNQIAGIGFKRRPIYAPFLVWDLRIGNHLYLKLANPIPE